ncbi:polysaccharide deacetylase family protein [Nocardia abscessus]|uniref:polysaccharide deacetylase family protein n=1 Tax=Nocardia abscessus TaxID=120957 RepID=UPI0024554D4D|nr:polysaccharide deacetylase family protein [Nocardia abscessus]
MTVQYADPRVGSASGWPLVLYFHHVRADMTHYTALTPDAFRRGLDLILSEFGPALDPGTVRAGFVPPARPSVLITFDDGYRDNWEIAAPILAEFDVRIALFCVTDELEATGESPDSEFMNWRQAMEMRAARHLLAAHTRTHPKLTDLDARSVRQEIHGSLSAVAERTGQPTSLFAYPYGLVPAGAVLGPDVLGFSTVKVRPKPWDLAPHRIRRTYLPTHDSESWPALVREWKRQWYVSQ